ncbi:TIGR02594 family protein [uncultured Bradyrhizobium sp.]|uniref:TIGR02594 family protein n=1 Tax=uncultured Bradyrhizobium sp. TaxID=199684 RepID=UPI0035CBF5C1
MVQFTAFRRLLGFIVLAAASLVFVASATPASARSHHHGAGRHARAHHVHHYLHRHLHHRHRHHHRRHVARAAAEDAGTTRSRAHMTSGARVSPAAARSSSSAVVAEARRYIGGNPTGRGRLWCARFMNMVLQRSGLHGTGSDMARSFASYGHRVSGPQVGAIAVMGRRGGGHVGVVSGIDASGNPIVVSGNHGHRVAESVYSRRRIYAYVMPTG